MRRTITALVTALAVLALVAGTVLAGVPEGLPAFTLTVPKYVPAGVAIPVSVKVVAGKGGLVVRKPLAAAGTATLPSGQVIAVTFKKLGFSSVVQGRFVLPRSLPKGTRVALHVTATYGAYTAPFDRPLIVMGQGPKPTPVPTPTPAPSVEPSVAPSESPQG